MRAQIEQHRALLQDQNRLSAYERAIAVAVQPGDLVVDLGAGTGILGWLALQAGARHVWAVDSSPAAHILQEAAARNGLRDRVSLLPRWSKDVQLDALVDVALCDQAGPLGWEGGLIQMMDDARQRLLKPAGRMVPSHVETWIAPSDRPTVQTAIEWWDLPVAGVDFSFVGAWAAEDLWVVDAGEPGGPTATSQLAASWALGTESGRQARRVDLAWTMTEDAHVSGFEGWFSCALTDGVSMTNGRVPGAISRPRRFLPLHRPWNTQANDTVMLRLQLSPASMVVSWSGQLVRDGLVVERFSSNNLGALLRTNRLPKR